MGLVDLAMDRIVPPHSLWPEFYDWAAAAFDLSDDSWDPAGRTPPYLTSLPYGKMMMAIYLLTYALRDEYVPQWHGRADYLDAARARANSYHEDQNYRFVEVGDNPAAEASTHREAGDDIDMHCPVFNLGGDSDDPVNRASVMVHEAWHHWQRHHGFESGHLPGSLDWYYLHGCTDFQFGQMWQYRIDPAGKRHLFHSPYQVQVEFDASIAVCSRPFIPFAVKDAGRNYGNTRLSNRFKNPPGYRIGEPKPF